MGRDEQFTAKAAAAVADKAAYDAYLRRLRDEFAMAALPAIIAHNELEPNPTAVTVAQSWARDAYLIADEMMKER